MKISHCSPVVYRFMKEEYIDRFLRNGELQLSTMSSYRKNPTIRQDEEEGEYLFYFTNKEGTVGIDCSIGANAYLLSTALSFAALHNKDHKYCLEFRDVDSLANIVANRLQAEYGFRVREIVVGPCNYSERMRTIALPDSMAFAEIGLKKGEMPEDDEIVDASLFYRKLRTQFGDRICFTKPARLLAEQEYRIIWLVDHVVEEPIKVHLTNPGSLATKIHSINMMTNEDKDRFFKVIRQRCKPEMDDLCRRLGEGK